MAENQLTAKVIGSGELLPHEERNGYIFWRRVAAFTSIRELFAAPELPLRNTVTPSM